MTRRVVLVFGGEVGFIATCFIIFLINWSLRLHSSGDLYSSKRGGEDYIIKKYENYHQPVRDRVYRITGKGKHGSDNV